MPAGGLVAEGGGGEAELGPHLVAGLEAAQLGGQQRVGHDILVNVPVLDAGDVVDVARKKTDFSVYYFVCWLIINMMSFEFTVTVVVEMVHDIVRSHAGAGFLLLQVSPW